MSVLVVSSSGAGHREACNGPWRPLGSCDDWRLKPSHRPNPGLLRPSLACDDVSDPSQGGGRPSRVHPPPADRSPPQGADAAKRYLQ